jgi:hypothetical protein
MTTLYSQLLPGNEIAVNVLYCTFSMLLYYINKLVLILCEADNVTYLSQYKVRIHNLKWQLDVWGAL